jgi:hypothetical protein
MGKLLFVALLLSFLMFCGQQNRIVTPVEIPPAEEYAVYNAVIDELYAGNDIKEFVIEDSTDAGVVADLDIGFEYAKTELPELTEEITANFKDRNKQAFGLDTLFNLKAPYVLISNQEINNIFQQPDLSGWDLFYQQYPNSQGILTLSRVGFNSTRDKALVSIGNQRAWLAGAGYFVLMIKENGQWKIQSKSMDWVS